MEFRYSENANFEDFASGRVLYGTGGMTNFPVRLLNEIFRRCVEYSEKKTDLSVYDPCCGGGYLLTVLGLCNRTVVKSLTGSDVDREVLKTAQKNLSLLSADGLSGREEEIKKLFSLYGKASHRDALSSIERLRGLISEGLFTETFVADATDLAGSLRKTNRVPAYFPPDIILTDIPYGHLVEWENKQTEIETFLQSLREVAKPSTILAVCMDKKQKFQLTGFCKLSQNNIGKRKFVIFRMP